MFWLKLIEQDSIYPTNGQMRKARLCADGETHITEALIVGATKSMRVLITSTLDETAIC